MWSCHHIGNFPRNHRFVLGERLERSLYELLIQAKYSKENRALLDAANLKLVIIRFQVRLAKDLQSLKANSDEFASGAVDEIGRMVGGWARKGK